MEKQINRSNVQFYIELNIGSYNNVFKATMQFRMDEISPMCAQSVLKNYTKSAFDLVAVEKKTSENTSLTIEEKHTFHNIPVKNALTFEDIVKEYMLEEENFKNFSLSQKEIALCFLQRYGMNEDDLTQVIETYTKGKQKKRVKTKIYDYN